VSTPVEHEPQCPRCGYNLRGTVATWPQYGFCPLEGVCTECGLHFEWANVYDPGRSEPAWCVEYIARRRLVRGCVLTAFRSVLPWRFWSRLRMHHRVRPRRLAAYVLFFLALWLVVYGGTQTAIVMAARQWSMNAAMNYWMFLPVQILRLESKGWPESGLAEFRQLAAGPPPQFERSAIAAIVEAVFNPLRAESSAIVWDARQREYDMSIGYWLAMNGIRVGSLPFGIALGLGIYALFPLSLVLLPISRRRAQIRWRHILRIAAYGFVIPVGVATLTHLLIAVSVSPLPLGLTRWVYVVTQAALPALTLAGTPVLLIVWWGVAMRCHLKSRHAFTTAVLLSIVCALVIVWMLYLLRVEMFV
jgi:hypothetical protein